MKMHYVRYLEGRTDLCTASGPCMVIRHTFRPGCEISRFSGYRKKSAAVAHVAAVNVAAGKSIAVYAGAFEAPKGMECYQLPEPPAAPLHSEPTAVGDQLLIPGCEKRQNREGASPKQASLWDCP